MRPYLIATILAALIILAGILFTRMTFGEIDDNFEKQRQMLKEQKQNGTLPEHWKNVDLDSLQWGDVGMKLSSNMQTRLSVAMFLRDFWFALIPVTIAVCIAGALVLARALK
jgi:ABC-type antimicrobial peptide transport system permease subunit